MTEKDLRRLSRRDLVEIIYQLQIENRALEQRARELTEKLEERTLILSEAGSIAEASIAINRVFEAAQRAADQYLDSVKAAAGLPADKKRLTAEQLTEETHKVSGQRERHLPGESTELIEQLSGDSRK